MNKQIFWTKEKCAEEALKYNSRIEFKTKNRYAYMKACEYKCLDEICKYDTKYKVRNYWTKERCNEEALKYTKISDFMKHSKGAYSSADKNGWLDEICSHIKSTYKPNGYWTKERCMKEALKYKTKKDFIKMSNSAYSLSYKNGWLDEICSHMRLIGNMYNRCIYAFEFEDNSVYVGLTYNFEKRQKEHLINSNKKSSVYKHINICSRYCCKQLTDYINVYEASLLEEQIKNEYKNNGWNILNKNKCGSIGGFLGRKTKANFS